MSGAAATHVPVLLREAIEALAIQANGTYIDCTFGRGGHSAEILRRLGPAGRLIALDRDPSALSCEKAIELGRDARFRLEHADFRGIEAVTDQLQVTGQVSGLLLDLGVSSPQLDDAERGFSFLQAGPLDMRMDTSRGPTAAEWLDDITADELAKVLREYGEERFAGRIAKAIVAARPLRSTAELAAVIEASVPVRDRHKHPATRCFQAIRIAVNGELEALDAVLEQAVEILAPGGRLAVIAFHSLEDRRVKRFIRFHENGPVVPAHLPPVPHRRRLRAVGKALKAGEEETSLNVRARSAVLRVAEKLNE